MSKRGVLTALVGIWLFVLIAGVQAQFTSINGVIQLRGLTIIGTGKLKLPDMSSTVPQITGSNVAYGFGSATTIPFEVISNSVAKLYVGTPGAFGVNLSSDGLYMFNSGTAVSSGSPDTGIGRNAAGVVEFNNGTAGTITTAVKAARYDAIGTVAVAVANVGANSCGTTAATIAGNDNIGAFTVGAGSGTQCRITFVVAAPTRRHCTFNDESTTTAVRSTYVDTTHTDAIGSFTAGDVVSYVCLSR